LKKRPHHPCITHQQAAQYSKVPAVMLPSVASPDDRPHRVFHLVLS
jgi:hypothetical protein